MLSLSFALHANLRYAEIPREEIPEVIKKSYLPVLEGLVKIKQSRVILDLTGITLEILAQDYPEIIKIIKQGIKNGQFEITGGTYSQPILPLLPFISIKRQINTHLELIKRVLGVSQPKGFWLPEAAWSPDLAPILKSLKFAWTLIDYNHLLLSQTRTGEESPPVEKKLPCFVKKGVDFLSYSSVQRLINLPSLFSQFRREIDDPNFQPILIKGASQTTLSGVILKQIWSPFYTGVSLANKLTFTQGRLKKKIEKMSTNRSVRGLFIPFGSDLEIIGYQGILPLSIPVENFLDLVNWVVSNKNIGLVFPTEYLSHHPPQEAYYLRTGSWAPDRSLKIWSDDPDDRRLNYLCDWAREEILKMPAGPGKEKAWRFLMHAENSDGRGWTPIPERRLDCFDNVLLAIKIAEGSSK